MTLRAHNLRRLANEAFDVLIVGAGINGAVCAAALSAQGARVALIDRGDFGSATSQESSNLIWGGIKYLETLELPLVRKLCRCRNELLRRNPANIREIRFLTVIDRSFRWPRVFLYLGTWFYWLLGNGFTRTPRLLTRLQLAAEEPLVNTDHITGGFEYSDAQIVDNDARFVFSFVRTALDHGAAAAHYVEALSAVRAADGEWSTTVCDTDGGHGPFAIRSRVLINACGPWVDTFNDRTGVETHYRHVFSKGIHLTVPRVGAHDRVLTFFANDGRMFFVIPMGPVSSIGTTDTRVDDPRAEVTEADRDFVLDNINARLKLDQPLTRADILAERCGLRPLAVQRDDADPADQDWTSLSRKHVIESDPARGYISIFGGKLTDALDVGREVTLLIKSFGIDLHHPDAAWFGEPGPAVREEFLLQAKRLGLDQPASPASAEPSSIRLWRRYGHRAFGLLEDIRRDPAMADVVIEGTEILRCELHHAAGHEMMTRLEDFLRRRTMIAMIQRRDTIEHAAGLHEACRILFGDDAERRFGEYFRGAGARPGKAAEIASGAGATSTRQG